MLPLNKDIHIDLTAAAFEQIKLMQQNDYTLEGLLFRLKIGGKGCEGFTYETGFSQKLPEDLELEYLHQEYKLQILIDKFTAHYCSEGVLDFIFDPNGQEGFTFTNANESKYHGKFFKDESMLPPEDYTQ